MSFILYVKNSILITVCFLKKFKQNLRMMLLFAIKNKHKFIKLFSDIKQKNSLPTLFMN